MVQPLTSHKLTSKNFLGGGGGQSITMQPWLARMLHDKAGPEVIGIHLPMSAKCLD